MIKKLIKIIIVTVGVSLLSYYCFKIYKHFDIDTRLISSTKQSRAYFDLYLMDDGKVLVYGGVDWVDGIRITLDSVEIYDPKSEEFYLTSNKALDLIHTEREIYGITYNIGEIPIQASHDLYIIRHKNAYVEEIKKPVMICDVYSIIKKTKIKEVWLPRQSLATLVFGFSDRILFISGRDKSEMKKFGSGAFYFLRDIEDADKMGGKSFKSFHRIKTPMHKQRLGEAMGLKLRNGKVLIYGGKDSFASFAADGELFDPATEKFNFIRGRETRSSLSSMIELKNGDVLIVGTGREPSEIIPAKVLR